MQEDKYRKFAYSLGEHQCSAPRLHGSKSPGANFLINVASAQRSDLRQVHYRIAADAAQPR
jgi:hypothetical protein